MTYSYDVWQSGFSTAKPTYYYQPTEMFHVENKANGTYNNSVFLATDRNAGVLSQGKGKKLLSTSQLSDRLCSPPSLLANEDRGAFLRVKRRGL
jgi:hypothetical protein